jgi:transcriptional regulator with XRE-family HTH domain
MSDLEAIGRTLQALRLNLGLSRAKMAAELKMPESAVVRHEGGRKAPAVDEMMRYLKVLRCTAAEFERMREDMAKFRGRTKQWWQHTDMTAPEDDLAEIGEDFARVARRFLGEMFKKYEEHR